MISHAKGNTNIIVYATWALSYLSDGGDIERIGQVVSFVPSMITLLESECASNVLMPTLRTLGNIVRGDETQIQTVIDEGILRHASKLLHSPDVRMRCKCHEVYQLLLSSLFLE